MVDFGGKAYGLNELQKAGLKVPEYLVFHFGERAASALELVKEKFDPNDLLAIRSSAAGEDSAEQSMAGAFHTELMVDVAHFDEAWSQVLKALPKDGKHGIIVQRMVIGEFSGVTFVDPKTNRLIINALPGICKPVVDGYSADHYEYNDGQWQRWQVAEEKDCLQEVMGELEWQKSKDTLPNDQLNLILKHCMQAAKSLDKPLDIEWTIQNGEFVFLQARPITVNPWNEERIRIYDSANVGESYAGMVKPLTATFANTLYKGVYEDLLRHSAVPEAIIQRHQQITSQMVETVHARMYYRMDQWYAYLRLLPGSKRNAAQLEQMLMLNSSDSNEYAHIKPSWWLRIVYYPLVIWKLCFFCRNMRQLERDALSLLAQARKWPVDDWDWEQVTGQIRDLMNGIFKRWYLTVENDTVMMGLFAHLNKPGRAVQLEQALQFHSISTDQVKMLLNLSNRIKDDKAASDAILAQDESAFKSRLVQDEGLKECYEAYMQQFGGRFANELKLESSDISTDFRAFAKLVKMYWSGSATYSVVQPQPAKSWLVKVFRRFASRRERFRLYRAMFFAVVRRLVLRLGDLAVAAGYLKTNTEIFWLEWTELLSEEPNEKWMQRVDERAKLFDYHRLQTPPPYFTVQHGRWPKFKEANLVKGQSNMHGIGASSGVAAGKATVMPEMNMDAQSLDVLITVRTDPGWTPLMALSKALVVEHGGMLSHASIVARELGIPAVIGVMDACQKIRSGDQLTVDGEKGYVVVMNKVGSDE